MRYLLSIIAVVGLNSILAAPAAAQLNTTIQLPTFGYTTATTTVSVPDRGGVLLGGVNSYGAQRNQLGTPLVGKLPFLGRPFNNVATGTQHGATSLSVHAYIHDFEAMEETLMAQAAASRAQRGVLAASYSPRPYQLVGQDAAAPSIAEIHQRRLERQQAEAVAEREKMGELRDLWYRARDAEEKGKPAVAKIFYRMISRDATGRVKEAALARLDALGSPDASKIAVNSVR
jgi:hypothetical protein